jgi:DNA replication protein DnaC
MKEKIKHVLDSLKLPEIKKIYADYAEMARKENLKYEEYLLELLQAEYEARKNNRIERMLKESRLPLEKCIKNFDRKRLPLKVNNQVSVLLDGTFIDRKENVLAFGTPGGGKTHLMCALAQELIFKNRRILFKPCNLLVQELLIAKKELKLAKILKAISKYDALIIDDIGYVQQNRDEMEVFFTLLADRYERSSIMITSNLAFSDWGKIFKDPMTTAAAIDRLVHHSVILDMNITSYRLESAKRKKEVKVNTAI